MVNELKEPLYFSEIGVRKLFVNSVPSGLYTGKTVDGKDVVVQVDKGKGMDVKYLNDKGWYECVEYNSSGWLQCEWVEKGGKESKHKFSREE